VGEEEARSWHWADADGVVSIVDEWELLSSLTMGTLPHYTLVWQPGWAEWLPACQVAELANVLPKDKIEKAVEPKRDPKREAPPEPPVDRYQAYATRTAAVKLLGRSKPPSRTPPPAPGTIRPVPPPPAPPRPAQPTLVEGAMIPSTATLRPPGAVPPPPRPVPVSPTPVVEPGPPSAVIVPTAPMIQIVSAEASGPPSGDRPTNPRAQPPPLHSPLPSWSDDLDSELRAAAPGRAAVRGPRGALPPGGATRSPILVMALVIGGGLAVLAVVVIAVVALRAMNADQSSTPATKAGSKRADARAPLLPCMLGKPAIRLAERILPNITPVSAGVPGRAKLALGYASGERVGDGIVIDPATLSVERPFERKTERDVSGIIPAVTSGTLSFEVDQESADFSMPRTLDTRPRIALGWSRSGLARRLGNEEPVTIWPSPTDKVTDPRVAALPAGGFAVTARRGGQDGNVVVGLLDPKAARASDLIDIASKPQVGTPSIAAGEEGVLIAFAGRPSDESYWGLQLAAAPPGQQPRAAQPFSTPPGGPGADAISPTVEALSNSRWLLQWTEGASGRRQVRVQTMGFDLVPIGDPITVSPEEANAGQGVVMVQDGNALSVFLVKKGKTHELWGASLSCP
jgi:hypothetical protein